MEELFLKSIEAFNDHRHWIMGIALLYPAAVIAKWICEVFRSIQEEMDE